jgi:hypothetical protein
MMSKLSSHAINSGAQATRALALRGIDPALRSALETEAARLKMSLNAVVLHILRSSLDLTEASGLHHDLDDLSGAWSPEEQEEFTSAVQPFEEVDPALWQAGPEAP